MKFRVQLVAVVLLLVAVPFSCAAQEKKADAAASWPAANPKDVGSLDAIVAAVYDVISGPAGDRDWNRFRSLFVPEGLMRLCVDRDRVNSCEREFLRQGAQHRDAGGATDLRHLCTTDRMLRFALRKLAHRDRPAGIRMQPRLDIGVDAQRTQHVD